MAQEKKTQGTDYRGLLRETARELDKICGEMSVTNAATQYLTERIAQLTEDDITKMDDITARITLLQAYRELGKIAIILADYVHKNEEIEERLAEITAGIFE